MGYRITNKIKQFAKKHEGAMDRALNRMAVDIERLSKQFVPHKDGQLKSSGRHRKRDKFKYTVSYDMEYAAFQEYGGDGKRVVRRYSKAGKKKFYLRDAGNSISSKVINYFRSEAGKIKI